MNRFATLLCLTAVLFLAALAATAVPARSVTFGGSPCGVGQRTPTFTECGASCEEASTSVSLDTAGSISCDPASFQPAITCSQQSDGSWQATGYAFYTCSCVQE